MKKIMIATAALGALLMASVHAAEPMHDGMAKPHDKMCQDTMCKEKMAKDGMQKDGMKKEAMNRDKMKQGNISPQTMSH